MEFDKNFPKILLELLTVVLFIFGINLYQNQPYFSEIKEPKEVKVEEVIDGDTIRVKDIDSNEVFRVRYLGVDTPELDGLDYESCFGLQAKERNEELVLDQNLILEFDKDKYDQFGRTLAYIYTLDVLGEKDVFINLKLLEEGYGRFYIDKQNTLFQDELVEATLIAQEDYSGLWGSCGETQFNDECVIKGNIDRLGQKYYHIPDDKYYSQTVIDLLEEDQWLCTIEEAEAKNFQRAND
jgi:micrococcal nuclease